MAKSFYEPKKVVRYQDSVLKPQSGLGSAPTPALGTTVSRVTPKTSQATPIPTTPTAPSVPPTPSTPPPTVAVVSTATTPPPAPAPPVTTPTPPQVPGETRAFLFDGATELTGSLGNVFGSDVQQLQLYVHGTFTPGWGEADTGSYSIFSIATPGTDQDRCDVFITRRAFGAKYMDYVEFRRLSGSSHRTGGQVLSKDGLFYSGSIEEAYIQFKVDYSNAGYVKLNGTDTPHMYTGYGANISGIDWYKKIPSSSLAFSIGGMNSGSDHYYTGSISNFAISKKNTLVSRQTIGDLTNDPDMILYYKFEGNTEATKGFDLTVVGTEAYVSSSL